MSRGKNIRPNLKNLSGGQLELLRKALKVDKNIAAGLLRKWFGGGQNGKQKMDTQSGGNTESN